MALNPTLASEQWTDMRKGLRIRLITILRIRMRIPMRMIMKLILWIILTSILRSKYSESLSIRSAHIGLVILGFRAVKA